MTSVCNVLIIGERNQSSNESVAVSLQSKKNSNAKPRWSNLEESILLNLVNENKHKDTFKNHRNTFFNDLEAEFNSKTNTDHHRSADGMRRHYDKMNKRKKKEENESSNESIAVPSIPTMYAFIFNISKF